MLKKKAEGGKSWFCDCKTSRVGDVHVGNKQTALACTW